MKSITYLFFLTQLTILSAQTNNADTYAWKFASQRSDLAPTWHIDLQQKFNDAPTLVLAGGKKAIANGHFYTTRKVSPLAYYQFKAHFIARNVEDPLRCVLARVLWQDASGKQVKRAEYPATSDKIANDWNIIEQLYQVPEGAVQARIELIYRWDADGVVRFGGISFEETEKPMTRKVRLASIHHRPRKSKGPRANLEQFATYIGQAAEQGADIVCLPEGVTLVGTGLNYVEASEPIPGLTTRFLGKVAKEHNLYIVAGMLEKEGTAVYNTAILMDRKGELVGKYRKVSLPREEIEGGVTPGNELPVFKTDFGTIGLMICWDVSFPETARTLATKGAEVIFMPIWGGMLTLAKARAIENQLYLVSSTYDMKTAVFNPEGEIMDEATEDKPVIVVEVDLNERTLWPWLGDFKHRIPREMPSRKALEKKTANQ